MGLPFPLSRPVIRDTDQSDTSDRHLDRLARVMVQHLPPPQQHRLPHLQP